MTILTKLMDKGVEIPNPETVYISDDVDIDRISGDGVILYNGTKLIGERTLISPGCRIGYEAPVTMENCLLGVNTLLHGGYFQDAVFLGENVFGSNAHVRKGTILEEQANAAHTVGLKQTILFPFVTLGSLINFCDCFMAGGTSRKDHSEVGSSYIHFNYTPNQDKATPSMMGNVHQGVMLNQPPIFLGGQGGLVGPARIGFGCITAAGSIVRKGDERPGRLIMGGGLKTASLPWQAGVYTQPQRIFNANLAYIAGLHALSAWYRHIRPMFVSGVLSEYLVKGLQENLAVCIDERINRLSAFGEKLKRSRSMVEEKAKGQGSRAVEAHDTVLDAIALALERFDGLKAPPPLNSEGRVFVQDISHAISEQGKDYVSVIQGLSPEAADRGSNWLAAVEKDLIHPLRV